MRGSLGSQDALLVLGGIIPAHAGLTLPGRLDVAPVRDHPRACGAHCSRLHRHHLCLGSSPRMRGSLDIRPPYQREFGIIPAHAGLTIFMKSIKMTTGDHPRACGAHRRRL